MSTTEEFAGLMTTGYYGGKEQVSPENEMFHSIYISGTQRVNYKNETEQPGKIQIRGVAYNLNEVNMIITHVKEVLVNVVRDNGKDNIKCFSYKSGEPPWIGTSKISNGINRECPITSAERAMNEFCNKCRNQIIVAGIYSNADGSLIKTDDNKLIYVFIRAKGMRYSNVSNYLNDLYNDDEIGLIFEPPTKESLLFEKSVVNNKRFITNLTVGSETSSFGNSVNVFNLKRGLKLPKETVLNVLKISKSILNEFNDKFDWSKNVKFINKPLEKGILTIDNIDDNKKEEVKEEDKVEKTFNFDGISF
jgi:hypothetical protein